MDNNNNNNNNNNSNNISNNNNNIENINYEVETYSNSENNSMPQSNNSFYQNTTNYPQNIGNDNENPIIDNQNHNRNNIQKNNNPALGQRRMNHNSNSLTEGNNNKNQPDKQNKGINNNNNKPNNNQNNTPNKNDNPNNSANGNNNKNPLPGSVNNKDNSDKNKNDPNKNSVKPKQDKKKDFNPKKNLQDYTPGNMVRNAASRLGLGNKKEDDSNKSSGGQASNVIKGGLKNLWAMAPLSVKITVASTAGVLAIIAIILLAILGGTTGVIVSSMCDSDSNGSTAYTGSADVKEFLCKIQAPVTNASMSSSIGERDCEFHGREWHSGVDFAVGEGTPVYAAEAGKVVLANREGCRGNNIVIEHNGNLHTRYLHLSELKVHEGDSVSKGQLIGKSGNTGSCTTGAHLHFEVISGSDYNYWVLTEISKMSEVYPSITNERFSNPESFKQNCGSTWQGDTAGESAGKSNGSTTYTSSSSTSSSFVSSSGTFAKYNLSETQLKGLAAIALREQGSPKGAAAEASLMANRFEMYGSSFGTGAEGLVKYVTTSGWFADSRGTYNSGTSNKEIIKAVRSVLVDGKRTLAGYVDEHDCWNCNSYNRCSNGMQGDICTLRNKSTVYTKMSDINNRSNYIQHETIVGNVYRSNYTFYSFPTENSDPFGYTATAKTKRATIGDAYYDFDTGKLVNGSENNSSNDDECCANTTSSSSDSSEKYCPNGITVEGSGTYSLDDYIAGVITAENSYEKDGKIEASKANAIAARTYAINSTNNCKDPIGNSSNSQNYKNPGAIGKKASSETSGQVMLYNGKVFSAEYDAFCINDDDCPDSSCSGNSCTVKYLKKPSDVTQTITLKKGSSLYDSVIAGNYNNKGHARGMSQLVARQMQDEGKTYDQILRFFYADGIEITGTPHNNTCRLGGNSTFQGIVYKYKQTDYPNDPYCGGTIANSGCGPTSMAIVVSSLLGEEHKPPELAKASSYCSTNSREYFTEAGKKYGLNVKITEDADEVLIALNRRDSLVIVDVTSAQIDGINSFWTYGGHYIAVAGTDDEGKVWVQNPGSATGHGNDGVYDFEKQIKPAALFYAIVSQK